MNDAEWNQLSNAVIDGVASEADTRRVSDEIEANALRARDFARLAFLHDTLDGALARRIESGHRLPRLDIPLIARRAALAAAVLLVVAGAAWMVIGTTREASAAEVLAKLIDATRRGDRTYFVRALGTDAKPEAARRNGKAVPSIDGAVLYLRSPSSYVLARVDGEGGEVLTGSDGASAWIVPARGSVRVSRDSRRFSGALPGSQWGVAFIDPHGDLEQLAAAYDLVLVPPTAEMPLAQIVASRRSDARGGPRRIEIAYEPATALIRMMRLEHLPQARGGPRSVEFELVDDAALDTRFFTHGFHHGADRTVFQED